MEDSPIDVTQNTLSLAAFLDMAEDYLRDGFRQDRSEPGFSSPPMPESPVSAPPILEPRLSRELSPQTRNLAEELDSLGAEIRGCTRCSLSCGKPVSAQGVSNPLVAVIGASPGEAGRLFSPEAGQLLDKMLGSIGLSREQNCYLTAALKCPIPLTGDIPLEAPASCLGFLARELDLLKPAFILCLGRTAARLLLGSAETMERLRGRFFDYQGASGFGIPLLPTYHPEECLEEPGLKRPIWEDLKTLRSRISPVQRVLSGGA